MATSFPPAHAGPKQVRAYVAQLLISRHDSDVDFAKRTADLWQLGRGVDFRSAARLVTDKQFRDTFGDTVGPFLYGSVREEFVAEYRASMIGTLSSWTMTITPVIAVLLLIRAARQPSQERVIKALLQTGVAVGPSLLVCAIIERTYLSSTAPGVVLFVVGLAICWATALGAAAAYAQANAKKELALTTEDKQRSQ